MTDTILFISNPQTMSSYIQNCDGLYILLPIVLHMIVPLCSDNLTL